MGNVVWCAIGFSLLTTVRELFDNGENALLSNQTLAYTLRDLEAFFMVGAFVAAAAPTYAINSIAFFSDQVHTQRLEYIQTSVSAMKYSCHFFSQKEANIYAGGGVIFAASQPFYGNMQNCLKFAAYKQTSGSCACIVASKLL